MVRRKKQYPCKHVVSLLSYVCLLKCETRIKMVKVYKVTCVWCFSVSVNRKFSSDTP